MEKEKRITYFSTLDKENLRKNAENARKYRKLKKEEDKQLSSIYIRMKQVDRDRFYNICKRKGQMPSRVLKEIIKKYCDEVENKELKG